MIKFFTDSVLNDSVYQFLTNKDQINDAEEILSSLDGHLCWED